MNSNQIFEYLIKLAIQIFNQTKIIDFLWSKLIDKFKLFLAVIWMIQVHE